MSALKQPKRSTKDIAEMLSPAPTIRAPKKPKKQQAAPAPIIEEPSADPIEDPDTLNDNDLLDAVKEAESKALVARNTLHGDMQLTTHKRDSTELLKHIVHKPTRLLFTYFRDPQPYKLHMYDVQPSDFNLKLQVWEGKKLESMKAKYPNWKKTREVSIYPRVKQADPSDTLVPRQFSFLFPYMKVAFAMFGEFGNKDDDSQFAPKDKVHQWERKLGLTEEAFDAESSDERGRNIEGAKAMDWMTAADEAFLMQVVRNSALCSNVKESCKELAKTLVENPRDEIYYNKDPSIVVQSLFKRRQTIHVKVNKDSKLRNIYVSTNLWRMRTEDEVKNGYTPPTPGLQEHIDQMGSTSYQHYEGGKWAKKAVNELPVYVAKTREESDATLKQLEKLQKTNYDEFLKQRAELLRPFRKVTFEESTTIAKDDLVAPLVSFRVNDGAANDQHFGLQVQLEALFWKKPEGNRAFSSELPDKPFYMEDDE